MRKQQTVRPPYPYFAALPLIALTAALIHVLGGLAAARLTPDDLAAISETGLIPLTGEQEGDYPGKDYVVVETMKINRGQVVSFAPGTRLFFHDNAKITINGTLKCEGTYAKPVTIGKLPFKLPKLSASSATMLFDSTTIAVYRGGSLLLSHTTLADPTVKIGLTDISSVFTFDSVVTADNRFFIPDTVSYFPKNAVVTCSNATDELYTPCTPILPEVPKIPVSSPEKKPFVVSPRLPFRIVLGAVAVGGAGAWYYYNREVQRTGDNYHAEDRRLTAEYAATGKKPDNTDALEKYHADNKAASLYQNIAAIAGGCGLTGFTLTFLIGGHGR